MSVCWVLSRTDTVKVIWQRFLLSKVAGRPQVPLRALFQTQTGTRVVPSAKWIAYSKKESKGPRSDLLKWNKAWIILLFKLREYQNSCRYHHARATSTYGLKIRKIWIYMSKNVNLVRLYSVTVLTFMFFFLLKYHINQVNNTIQDIYINSLSLSWYNTGQHKLSVFHSLFHFLIHHLSG